MDPFLLQRALGQLLDAAPLCWQPSPSAASASHTAAAAAAAAAAAQASPWEDDTIPSLAAGYFPLAPSHHGGLLLPFTQHDEADARFELLMTGIASLVIVAMWVGGLALWYAYCIRRPPRLFCGE